MQALEMHKGNMELSNHYEGWHVPRNCWDQQLRDLYAALEAGVVQGREPTPLTLSGG